MYAMGGGQGEGGSLVSLLPFVAIFVVMYFLMIRPQQRKQKEMQKMLEALEKGDKVVTAGGMIVTIESFKNEGKSVIVRIDQNTRAEIQRQSITQVVRSKGNSENE
jgi:preprotein translocase subunit YajC